MEVLLLLNGNWFTATELAEYKDIDIKHADFLLRHYHKYHYLKRKKFNSDNGRLQFHYTLTNAGLEHLKWLEKGEQIPYQEWYEEYIEFLNHIGSDSEGVSFNDYKKAIEIID